MKIDTTPGKTYCVTTSGGCNIYYTGSSGLDTTLLTMTSEGQGYFTAPGLRIECTDEHASVTECKGGFSFASAGSSAGGGGTPTPEGMEAISGIPADNVLHDSKVYMIDNPTAAVDLSGVNLNVPAGRVVTCEVWVTMGAAAVPITFPRSWQWIGSQPDMSTPMRSYRFTMRCAYGQRPEICHAYTALNSL